MVDIGEVVKKLQEKTGPFSEKLIATFIERSLQIIKTEGAREIRAKFLEAYDKLAEIEEGEMGPRIRGKDPLSLKNARFLFEAQLDKDLSRIRLEGLEIIIELLSETAIGIGTTEAPKGTPSTMDFLGFYIEGFVGEHAFITPEHLRLKRPNDTTEYGRLGLGFLISKEDYVAEKWEKRTNIKFEEVRHAISGQSPYGGFKEATQKIDLSEYLQKALKETVKLLEDTKV